MSLTPLRSARPRRGATLSELLVGLVLGAIVGGAVLGVLTSQQRAVSRAMTTFDARSQVRQALGLLASELRGVAPRSGDLVVAGDSVMEFHAPVGASVICALQRLPFSAVVVLAPSRGNNLTLSGWMDAPQAGDSLRVLDEATGSFRSTVVSTVDSSSTTCPTPPLGVGTSGVVRYTLTLGDTLPTAAGIGAPVRLTRRVRYALALTTRDGQWYLTRRIQTANGALATSEIVSGPYLPYAAGPAGGLRFRYVDSTGALITPTTAAERQRVVGVRIVVRSEPAGRPGAPPRAASADSLTVGFRNR